MPEEPSTENSAKRLTPAKGGKPALAIVNLLDGKTLEVNVERKAKGEKIFDEVCDHLDLQEKDYFGLSFRDKVGRRTWLDLDKRIGKVLKGEPWRLDFEVKFYPKDPAQLQEDFTRYLLCLQVRNDILSGKLPCSFVTHAMLGSYLVQSQLGDYSAEEYPDASYLSGFKFCPEPAPGLEERVMALHKGHKGQTPAEAELHYLENAKKLAMYGVDLHPVKDLEGVDLQLGVCSTGLLVYQDLLRINRFAWPKILKISYRRNNFYIKIRPGEFEQYEQTVGFKLDSSRAAKNLWKVCVDQHTFFRLMSADAIKRPTMMFPRIGSLYRWNRKTQVEVLGSTIPRNSQNFERSHSCRPSRSLDALGQVPQDGPIDENVKRHTMSHAPARPHHASPARPEKRPAGGVAVLPMEPFKKKVDKEREKDNGTNGMGANDFEDDEKENRSNRIEQPSTPTKDESPDKKKQSPSHGFISIFGSPKDKKTPKDKENLEKKEKDKKKKDKERSREKIAVAETVSGETEADDRTKSPKKDSSLHGSLGKLGIGKDKSGKDDEAKDKKSKDKSKDKSSKDSKEKDKSKDASKEADGSPDDKSKKGDKLSVFKTDKKDKKKDKDKKDKDEKNKKEKKGGTLDSSKSADSTLDRSKTPEKDRSLNETEPSPYTKVYEYTADDDSGISKAKVSGFSYESDRTSPLSREGEEKSPTSPGRKETGVAFNYAPGEISGNKIGEEGSGSKKIFGLFGKKKDDAEKQMKQDEKAKGDKDNKYPSSKSDLLGSLKFGKHGSPKDKDGSPKSGTDKDESPKSGKDKDGSLKSTKDKHGSLKSNKDKDESLKSGKDKDGSLKSVKDKDDSLKSGKDKDSSLTSSKDKDGSLKSGKDKDDNLKSGKDKDSSLKSGKDKDGSPKSGKDKDGSSKSSKDKDGSTKSSKDKESSSKLFGKSDFFKLGKDSKSGKDGQESPKSSKGIVDTPKSSKDKQESSKTGKDTSADVSGAGSVDLTPSDLSKSKKSKKDDKNQKMKNSDFLEAERQAADLTEETRGPKIVKTTTKSSLVNTGGTLTQNVEEKIEDLGTGEVTHSTHVNTAEGLDESRSPYITATAVTTRTATTLEDLGTNAKTSQVEEKTVARSTTTTGLRQEQRVVTQEVRATTVVNDPQLRRSDSTSSLSSDDSGTPIDGDGGTYYIDRPQGPIVETETVVYSPVTDDTTGSDKTQQTPLVPTVAQILEDGTFALPGAVVTSQTITSKTRTVETLTYKTEKDGVVETRVEQKITIQSDGDPIDHDKALAEAIQEATAMNPDMRVEKIEIQQEALP